MKAHTALILVLLNCPCLLFSRGVAESDIPDPEIQHVLPDELTGDFIIPEIYMNVTISIYPSNKYIIKKRASDYTGEEYGHIVKKDGAYFFSHLKGGWDYVKSLARIYFDDAGLYFYSGDMKITALRKRPVEIGPAAARITAVMEEKSRYFKRRDDTSADEITKFTRPYSIFSLLLWINEGAVRIVLYFKDGVVYWEGYLEITEEGAGEAAGKIVFTEGAAFREVEDGIGSITINRERAKVILPCIGCFPDRESYGCGDPLDMVVIFEAES
jgi:hypothetical protein